MKLSERAKPKHELLLKQMRAAQTLQQRVDLVHVIFGLDAPNAAASSTALSENELPIFLRLLQLPSPIPAADPPTGFELLMRWVSEDPFFKESNNTAQAAAAASSLAAPSSQAALYESMVLQLFVGLDRRFAFWSSRKLSKLSPDELRVQAQLSQSLLFGLNPKAFAEVLSKLRERDDQLRPIINRFSSRSNVKLSTIARRLVSRMLESEKDFPAAAARAASAAASSSGENASGVSAATHREQERAEARAARKAEKRRLKAVAKSVSNQSWGHLTSHSSTSGHGRDGRDASRIQSVPQNPPAPARSTAAAAALPPSARSAAASVHPAREKLPTPGNAAKLATSSSSSSSSTAALTVAAPAVPINALAMAFLQDFSYPVSQAAGGTGFPRLSRAQELGLSSRLAPTATASTIGPHPPPWHPSRQQWHPSEVIGAGAPHISAPMNPPPQGQHWQMPELESHLSGRRSPQPSQQAPPMLPSMPHRPAPPLPTVRQSPDAEHADSSHPLLAVHTHLDS